MTVGIAAIFREPDGTQGIILCSDAMVSSYLGKAETMLKAKKLIPNWGVLVSGEDSEISGLLTILRRTARLRHAEQKVEKERLKAAGSPLAAFDQMDEAEMTRLVREALATRKVEKIDEFVRGRYGISYKEFLDMGKDKFPPDEFRRDILTIGATELGAEFIVAGFANGFPFLLETDTFGKTKARDDFAVVGSGASLAHSVMMHRAHTDVHSYEETLYCVYEAKKYAQGQPNVGDHTNIVTMRPDGTTALLNTAGYKWLAERYSEFGPREIPDDLSAENKDKFNKFS